MKEFIKSKMNLPVVDSRNHGPLTMDRFHICKRRLRVKEEFLPLIHRKFTKKRVEPYKGYKTQRDRPVKPPQEKIPLAVERTKEVVAIFQQSDEKALQDQKEEREEKWKCNWWEAKNDPEDELADDHYFDLIRLFNEELHQKYWEKEDWFNLWDHAISNEGYLPMEW